MIKHDVHTVPQTPAEAGRTSSGGTGVTRVAYYANVGPVLNHYEVDVEAGTLTKRGSVTLPSDVQYVWPHANSGFLYAVTSDVVPKSAVAGTEHFLAACRIDRATGALSVHGASVRLPTRPIHVTTDTPSKHVLVAFNKPSALRVYRINDDGTVGAEVSASPPADSGIFAHQVRMTPDNRYAVLVTRGNEAAEGKPEEPGALKIFEYSDGRLGRCHVVAPNNGFGFGPRHLDFHPAEPWIYISMERENKVWMFGMENGIIAREPTFRKEILEEPGNIRSKQMACTIHVHPNGKYVYATNRAYAVADYQGKKVQMGGENNMVVYAIDPNTGEHNLVQHIDTQGIYLRTFHIDPSGRLLVGAHIQKFTAKDGDSLKEVPASIVVFRIGDDGKLTFLRKYDVDVGERMMFWSGMVTL